MLNSGFPTSRMFLVLKVIVWQHYFIYRCIYRCHCHTLGWINRHVRLRRNVLTVLCPILIEMYAASYGRPAAVLAILFWSFWPPNLQGRADTKLCHMFSGDPGLQNSVSNLHPSSKNFGSPKTSKFRHNFKQLFDLIVNISRTLQDIVERKMALQTDHSRTCMCT